ncbi:MAG: hypothetical protein WD595_04390 [Waddliaceae bacterium]
MTNANFDGNFFRDNPDILKVLPSLADLDLIGDGGATGNILEADILKDGLTALHSIVDLDAFLSSFEDGSGTIVGFPKSLDQFAQALSDFGGEAKADILNIFREAYLAHLGLNASGSPTAFPSTGTPTNEIEGQELVNTLGISLAELNQQADNFFNDFFAKFPLHTDATTGQKNLGYAVVAGDKVGGNSFHHLLSNFTRAFERIATFDSTDYRDDLVYVTSKNFIDSPTALSQYDVDYPTYQNVFNAFIGIDPAEYEEALAAYYNEVLQKTGNGDPNQGYFVPSLAFEGWVRTVYKMSQIGNVALVLSDDATRRTIVLDRIMRLIISMIEVIQQISISQAERLTFLSKWQQAYTQVLNQIPILAKGDGIAFSENDEQRNEFNTKANRLIEIVRARRQVIVDDSKSHQSTVNQSSDAVTQQVNIGTAILQQLSTLIGAIYR